MASPGNQHCADCIGTLSFRIADRLTLLILICLWLGVVPVTGSVYRPTNAKNRDEDVG